MKPLVAKMSFPSELDMMSKELQNSDLFYVNLMTDVFKTIVKYRRKIIAKYRNLSLSGNRALKTSFVISDMKVYLVKFFLLNINEATRLLDLDKPEHH